MFRTTLIILSASALLLIAGKNIEDEILSKEISGPESYIPQAFDVLNYNVWLNLWDAPKPDAYGWCEITFVWTEDPDTNKFYFHLRGMKVDSLFYGSESEEAVEVGDPSMPDYHFEVNPNSRAVKGDTVVLKIYYSGTMTHEEGNFVFGGVISEDSSLYSMGVGFYNNYVSAAQHWMPCYDHPSDKATYKGTFVTNYAYYVVSNGLLTQEYIGDATNKFEWTHDYQCATYMLNFAADNLVPTDFDYKDIPVVCYSRPEDTAAVKYAFKMLPEMISLFEEKLYKYPFDKVGYVIVPNQFGAMEHQTMISYPAGSLHSFVQSRDSTNFMAAHELSHQWFGGLVTLEDFRDAWLNEGFAVFCEGLWAEYLNEDYGFINFMYSKMVQYIQLAASEGVLPLYDFDRKPPSSNYPGTIYRKGGVVLGMLRYKLGDSLFFEGLTRYLDIYKYKNVTTEKFKKVMEEVSGSDLDNFFDEWVYGKGWPEITAEFKKTDLGNSMFHVTVRIEQVQKEEMGTYTALPLEIGFRIKKGGYQFKIITLDSTYGEFDLGDIPDFYSVNINRGPSVRVLLEAHVNVTSVDEKRYSDNGIQIFPNPAQNILNIKFDKTEIIDNINIYNITGATVSMPGINLPVHSEKFEIDISGLTPGEYYIVLELKNGEKLKGRFSKMR